MEEEIESKIKQIVNMTSQLNEIKTLKEEIDTYLFSHYCEKGYLAECEPEYCSYRYTHSCRYIRALHEIQDLYGINLKN